METYQLPEELGGGQVQAEYKGTLPLAEEPIHWYVLSSKAELRLPYKLRRAAPVEPTQPGIYLVGEDVVAVRRDYDLPRRWRAMEVDSGMGALHHIYTFEDLWNKVIRKDPAAQVVRLVPAAQPVMLPYTAKSLFGKQTVVDVKGEGEHISVTLWVQNHDKTLASLLMVPVEAAGMGRALIQAAGSHAD